MKTCSIHQDYKSGCINCLLGRIGALEDDLETLNQIAYDANQAIRDDKNVDLEKYRELLTLIETHNSNGGEPSGAEIMLGA